MKVRYKIGKFNHSVTVIPGDTLKLTLTDPNGTKQKVTEEINISMTVTHWIMFYVPEVGFGGMFGTSDIGSKVSEIFVEPERVNAEDNLIGDS